jgi:hypothetical protein
VLRCAAYHQPLGADDGEEEGDPEQRGDDVRRPETRGRARVVLLKLRIAPPRPSWIEAGSSPMIAPTTLAVAEILNAAKR